MNSVKNKSGLQRFLTNGKAYPVLYAVAAGLYPIFFYYSNNYSMVNTWGHLGYFAIFFLLVPIAGFVIGHRISKLSFFDRWRRYFLPFANVFVFLFLIKLCLYAGLQRKMIVGILFIAGLFAYFLHGHLKKLVIIQLILAVLSLVTLVPTVIKQINYSKEWLAQPDNIEQVKFHKRPNVYWIQPDGYVNFSELTRGPYSIDVSEMKSFLEAEGFVNYDDFRSNYSSTLSSNSATLAMKHHYYNKGTNFGEVMNSRDVIITDNAVLRIFNTNGYKTHFLTESPYLLMNRPTIGFDYSNFNYDDLSYIGTGLGAKRDVSEDLETQIKLPSEAPKFFFVEIFNPGHITGSKASSEGRVKEKEKWLTSLDKSNQKVTAAIKTIKENDPNALIILMADHGGYVGLDYTYELYTMTQDRDLIYSMFSSQLSILWPEEVPSYSETLKTPVNLFRHIFSYLAEDNSFLNFLEDDGTYTILRTGVPKGVYKYIDSTGEIVLEKKH